VRFLARNSLLMVDEIGCLPIGINSWQSVLPPHQCLLRALWINDPSFVFLECDTKSLMEVVPASMEGTACVTG
jgi:hypothetical protein